MAKPNHLLTVETNASDYPIAAILSITLDNGEIHPVVGGIDTVEVTQRFNAQCGVFNASLLSQTSSSNVVSLKLLCLRLSLITIYND